MKITLEEFFARRDPSEGPRLGWALWTVLIVIAFSQVACASRGRLIKSGAGKVARDSESAASNSVPTSEATVISPEVDDTSNPSIRDGIAVLLGPGWFRTWAGAGVLFELQEQQIPIDEIYALEMSAWVAATFSDSPQANSVQWRLQRINADCLSRQRSTLSSLLTPSKGTLDSKCLAQELENYFGSKRQESLSPSLWIGANTGVPAVLVEKSAVFEWRREGLLSEGVSSGLNYSGWVNLSGQPAGVLVQPPALSLEPMERPKKPLLIIDFAAQNELMGGCSGGKDRREGTVQELYLKDLCLFSKNLSKMKGSHLVVFAGSHSPHPFDAKLRNEMIYLGRLAVRKWLEALPGFRAR